MNCPAEIYQSSTRPTGACPSSIRSKPGLLELEYPFQDKVIGEPTADAFAWALSTVFAGQAVGIKEVQRRHLAGQLYGL
jgi:hypothetical protein